MRERLAAQASTDASVSRAGGMQEAARARGVFEAWCTGPDGKEKWRDTFDNVIMTEGKNAALDAYLAGSSYTVTGPYMGLISSVSYTAISAADTAAQLAGTNGWREAGGGNAPTYTGNRKTAVWSAASAGAKALSAALAFAITGSGTVKGAFLMFASGAVNTKDDANGKLYSAGLFSGGDKVVASGDTVNVSYSTSL